MPLKASIPFLEDNQKRFFPNEDTVFEIFYLRILELYKKWENRHVPSRTIVRNQFPNDERMPAFMVKYDKNYYDCNLHKTLDTFLQVSVLCLE